VVAAVLLFYAILEACGRLNAHR